MSNDEMADEYVVKYGFGNYHRNLTPEEVNIAIRQAYLAGLNDVKYPVA